VPNIGLGCRSRDVTTSILKSRGVVRTLMSQSRGGVTTSMPGVVHLSELWRELGQPCEMPEVIEYKD